MLDLQPDTITELTAANALNRPGPMESNAQTDYVKMKFGQKVAEYDYLLEDITKDTYGLYCFQEHVMTAYKVITECTMTEADKFRKIITKLHENQNLDEKTLKHKNTFVECYIKKGVSEEYANNVWDKLGAFSSYAFNIAHSASYAVLGYCSLWFKVYYPLEFWTISLQWSKEELISAKLAEIDQAGLVKVIAPDINNSNIGFRCDKKTDKIYWSISSVKFAGNIAVSAILEEREKNGKFKSLKDFVSRVNKSKVNKRVICCLILAGCFDEVEKIKEVKQRWDISVNYFKNILNEELPENLKGNEVYKDTYWQLKAKEICGYGYIDYGIIYRNLQKTINSKYKYYNAQQVTEAKEMPDDEILVIGNISQLAERMSKNGKYVKLMLDNNNLQFQVVVWNETYEKYKEQLKQNSIIAINCRMKKPDKYYSNNGLQTSKQSKIYFM